MTAQRMVAFRVALYASLALASVSSPSFAADENAPSVRGIVRAVNEAWISTDLDVRIASLPFREGQPFKKGEVLATFDCGDLAAQLKSAEALLRGEQLTTDNNARLAKLNAVGKFEVDMARVKLEQATAEVEAFQSKFSRCTINAPFDGRISMMRAHAHEFPDKSGPLMQIVDDSTLEIDILVPGVWLRWLKPGVAFSVTIEETGATIPAEVSRIAAVVDPVSQTVKITSRFTGDTKGVLPGMSGPAKFAVPNG